MNIAAIVTLLEGVEARVRPLVCDTYSRGRITREARISEDDLDIIRLIAGALRDLGDIDLNPVTDKYLVTTDAPLSEEHATLLKREMEAFLGASVFVASGLTNFNIQPVPRHSPDLMGDIVAFHRKFGIEYQGRARGLPNDLGEFRLKFLREELDEYYEASFIIDSELDHINPDVGVITRSLEQQLDALVDLVYVALGTAHLHGFDFNEAWRRVHAANMRKIRTPSADASKRGSAFDVIKPEGWEPPSHADLVENHEHRVKA